MKYISIIFKTEYLLLKRNRATYVALLLFMTLGLYSIYYGHSEIAKQKQKIETTADAIHKAEIAHLSNLTADTTTFAGKQAYETAVFPSLVRFNLNFLAANHPTTLAQLSLGQRDLYPYYYILNAQSLYTQTLKGDINNPFKLSAGNFDLAFVMVYLLPLLIIVLGLDIVSSEYEQGTYLLLHTANISFRHIIVLRLTFRYLLCAGLIALLSIAGFCIGHVNPVIDIGRILVWLLVLLVYSALWFTIIYLINSFRQSTSFNAIMALSVWIGLLMVVPSLLSIWVQSKQQAQAITLATLMRSRNMPETDEAMHKALSEFYPLYPDLKPKDTTKSPYFYYQGYSAFLLINDRLAKTEVDRFYAAIQRKNEIYQLFNPINPAVNTQEILNHLAGADLDAEMRFKSDVARYHQQIFWFSNQPLFQNRLLNALDYLHEPVFRRSPTKLNSERLWANLCILILSVVCVFLIAHKKLRVRLLKL